MKSNLLREIEKSLNKFKRDETGLAWILGVAFIALIMNAILYIPLSVAWMNVLDAITSGYVFTGSIASSLIVVEFIINYLVILGLFITGYWVLVQAKAKRYE